ncbi:MAG: PIN domain-containing protein [Patescibacteria group bacterium]
MYLVDTNVLILGIKGLDPDKNFLSKAVRKGQVLISVVSVAEFLTRASEEAKVKFEKLIDAFPPCGVDLEVARAAASYRGELLKVKRVQLLDCFLAAQAKVHNLTLVTNNKADFPMKDIKVVSP